MRHFQKTVTNKIISNGITKCRYLLSYGGNFVYRFLKPFQKVALNKQILNGANFERKLEMGIWNLRTEFLQYVEKFF